MSAPIELRGRRLVVASHNEGKVREIGALLHPLGVEPVSAGALGLPEPDETEDTFIGNALLKARAAALGAGMIALADDSGLAVDALGGAPGVLSARWAGPNRDFNVAMAQVWEASEQAGGPKTARFVCALAIVTPQGQELAVEGVVEGRLVWPMRGSRGFGYDPMFVPEGGDLTFGEMEPEAKHRISHRAQAFARLIEALS